jgi:hypothetical protein
MRATAQMPHSPCWPPPGDWWPPVGSLGWPRPCWKPTGAEAEGSPWQATVSYGNVTAPALTVVVSTGGHVQDV